MYTDAASLKLYLGIASATTADDTLLGLLIARAQQAIDSLCKRTFEASADTTRTFDAVCDVRGRSLWLNADLCAVTTVTNGNGSVLTTEYVTEPRSTTPYWALTLKRTSGLAWTYSDSPEDAIRITGRWAYSVTAPADIQHACIRLAGWFYRQKEGQGVDDRPLSTPGGVTILPSALPRDIRELLRPYKRVSL